MKKRPREITRNFSLIQGGGCTHSIQSNSSADQSQKILNRIKAVQKFSNAHQLADQNNKRSALKLYKEATEIDPTYALPWLNMGTIYSSYRSFEQALACYLKAAEIDPSYALAHYNLGVTYDNLGNEKEAERFYRKAIELDPSHADALYNLAMLIRGESPSESISLIEKYQQLNPGDISTQSLLAQLITNNPENEREKINAMISALENADYGNEKTAAFAAAYIETLREDLKKLEKPSAHKPVTEPKEP